MQKMAITFTDCAKKSLGIAFKEGKGGMSACLGGTSPARSQIRA